MAAALPHPVAALMPGPVAAGKCMHMNSRDDQAVVQIIGAPIACKEGVKDTWRDVASWAGGQLRARFGDQVRVEYLDLFDPACPPLPPNAQLPLVLVNGDVVSAGGKVSVPAIRKRLETLDISAVA
jgi:hypothetical protein